MKNYYCLLFLLVLGCDPAPVESIGLPPETSSENTSSNDGAALAPKVEVDSILTRRNFYVVFDGSGSMSSNMFGEDKIDIAKKAVIEFSKSLNDDDNLGLVAFDGSGCTERLLLGTKNRHEFASAINSISSDGGTPLYEAIDFALRRLQDQTKKQLNYGEYHLVVVTDGQATGMSEGSMIENIKNTPIVIHAIGFDIQSGHPLNRPGLTYYSQANSPQELKNSLKAVLAESEQFSD